MEKAIKRAKAINITAFGIVAALTIIGVITCIRFSNRPLDPCVTVDGIREAAQTQGAYAKSGESYYQVSSSTEFAAMFSFEEWTQVKSAPEGNPILLLTFAELWVVEFYPDGRAAAYNGYAADSRYKDHAYYQLPETVIDNLVAYLQTFGTPRTLGDGTISKSTFRHE